MTAGDRWRAQWLGQVVEDVIEPARPIVDPHHHLWRDYPPGPYLLPDLLADVTAGHNVLATVYVECGVSYRREGPEALRPVGETEFVAAVAAEAEKGPVRIGGIVAHADLRLGAVLEAVLDAHEGAGRGLFRGVRHMAAFDPAVKPMSARPVPAHLYADRVFREGVARLGRRGLTFDAWNYHPQIPELTAMARAVPETVIVFDHYGGPIGIGPYAGRRAEIFESWRKDVAELARCPNVVAKLGGLAMPVNGFGWHERVRPPTSEALAEAQRPYVLHTIDVFGPSRCMFESNFPVDKRSVSYRVLWNAFKRLAAPFSEAEKDALFRGTAARVYRLA